ncbi:MAG: sensor histidine kinase [Microbacteriaceae bacterium]
MSERTKRLLIELINPAVGLIFVIWWMVAEAGRWNALIGATEGAAVFPRLDSPLRSAFELVFQWFVSSLPFLLIGLSIAFARWKPRVSVGFGFVALLAAFPIPTLNLYSTWPALLGLAYALGNIVAFGSDRLFRWTPVLGVFGIFLTVLWMPVRGLRAGLSFWDTALGSIPLQLAYGLAVLAVAIGAGRWVRRSRSEIATLGGVRRQRDQATAESAALAARAAIARDVHDIMAHSLAVVAAQADGARYQVEAELGQGSPASMRQSAAVLSNIAEVSRDALRELRLVLDAADGSDERIQPNPDDLDVLIERTEHSGHPVQRIQLGEPVEVSAGYRLALYRIVQEGLTNAVKYAPAGSEIDLSIDWRDDAITVLISSELGQDAGSSELNIGARGRGIVGMTERAEMLGGWARAGADPAAERFIVTAYLPLGRAESTRPRDVVVVAA